jgi:GNAT superfamily N-acetyltransferase
MTELVELARAPWTTRIGFQPILIRPSSAWDLAAVAQMHTRCSPRSLLDRYRHGGRPPAVGAVDRALRNPLSFVALTRQGDVVAVGSLARDPHHAATCAEVGVLVEDSWQKRGLGSELTAHLAGAAQVAGFTELIAYPATAVPAVQRLMLEIGRTRVVPQSGDMHLHTYLAEGATLGLGSVRERLAG